MREKQIIRREKVWQEDRMREKLSSERYMGWQIVGINTRYEMRQVNSKQFNQSERVAR